MIAAVIILAVLIILFAVYLWALKPRPEPKTSVEPLKVDYAHRGLWGRDEVVENTMEAFRRAEAAGYGIELDVRLSSDGEIVVFHDDTLERLGGRPERVDELTASELSWVELGGSWDRMPMFEDVLDEIDPKVPLCIELKGKDVTLCEKVAALLDNYDRYYSVESFNPFLLEWFKKNRPRVVRGQLTNNLFRSNGKFSLFDKIVCLLMCFNFKSRPDYISYNIKYSNSLSVVLCRKLFHAMTIAWTIEDENDYEKAKELGSLRIFQKILPETNKEHK